MIRKLPLDPDDPTATGIELDDIAALIDAESRPAPAGRPWIAVNMVASADGATATDGVSGDLGSSVDTKVLVALRGMADIVLAGSATVTAERYRRVRLPAATKARRLERGQRAVPRIAVLSRQGTIDLDLPLFTDDDPDPDSRPIVLVAAGALVPDRREALEAVAVVVEVGSDQDGKLDVADATQLLGAEFAAATVLCEGGPTLNGLLLEADLVDEWCLTLAPTLVGGSSHRASHGGTSPGTKLGLERAWLHDSELLLRYRRMVTER